MLSYCPDVLKCPVSGFLESLEMFLEAASVGKKLGVINWRQKWGFRQRHEKTLSLYIYIYYITIINQHIIYILSSLY